MTRNGADGSVPDATLPSIERRRAATSEPLPPMLPTSLETQTSDGAGSTTGRSRSASGFRRSNPSGAPSTRSIRRYRKPSNVREFAALANEVATAVLNGEIDLDTARAYSAVARTVAQAMTAETVRARFLRTAPDFEFPEVAEDQ